MQTPRYYFSDEFKKFEEVIKNSNSKLEYFKKGEYLSATGEELDKIYYILDGTVKMSLIHESGREKTFSFHGPGTLIPYYYPSKFKLEKSLLLYAVTDIDVLSVDKLDFAGILESNFELCNIHFDVYVKLVNLLMYDIGNQLFNDSLVKTCNFLYSYLKIGESKNNIIDISQDELASIVGLNRISVAKNLKLLRDQDVIKTSRNRIVIVDSQKLLQLCSYDISDVSL